MASGTPEVDKTPIPKQPAFNPTIPIPSQDLLGGTISKLEQDQADFGIREHNQFYTLRQSMFSTALAFAFILYLVAIVLGGTLALALLEKSDIHWHAAILVAAFIVPPTLIVLALMKGIFRSSSKEKDESTGLPTADFLKEVMKKGIEAISKS